MVTRIGGPDIYSDDNPDAWLEAVVETCVPILDSLPEHLRVDAASTLYVESRAGPNVSTPWATIFDDDAPQWAGDQLLSTSLALDGQTSSHNSDLRGVVNAIYRTLGDREIERGTATTVAAGFLVQIAAGKQKNTPFKIYSDEAREMPMRYSWSDMLVKQFGEDVCRSILANPRLERIIRETEALTAMYYDDSELSYQRSPDDIGTLVHGFLPVDERYFAYVSAAREIRGLPTEE